MVEIYYFTGTGNSLAVARDLAERLDGRLIPVMSTMNRELIETGAEMIGLVFPIYDFKPPRPIEQFVSKLVGIGSKYLFGVCTYGITVGKSLQYLEEKARSFGGSFAGGFGVRMPLNGIGSRSGSERQHEFLFREWKKKREEIAGYVREKRQGNIDSSSVLFSFFQPRIIKLTPVLVRFLFRLMVKGVRSLALTADTRCNGCGVCVNICPVDNITMANGRPVWSDRCLGCFACLNWCPNEAVSLGGCDMNIKAYHHPDVTIEDMLDQKRSALHSFRTGA